MKQEETLKYLLERYLRREATEEELSQFFVAIKEVKPEKWRAILQSFLEEQKADPDYDAAHWEPMIKDILAQESEFSPFVEDEKSGRIWINSSRIAVAATIIVLLGIGVWFGLQRKSSETKVASTELIHSAKDIHPGGNKAVLTLANGKKIVLDSTQNGLLSTQGNTKVIKLNKGLLAYNKDNKTAAQQTGLQYNTIATPVGGQYKVVLPDGSKVWLNATSSIRFPVAFSGEKREVSIKGEAYFEIAKNEEKPFLVSVKDMQVMVLGTHFNIMAYEDEPAMQTTLLEGKVKVSVGGGSATLTNRGSATLTNRATNHRQDVVLNPGQVARIADGSDDIKVTETNTEEVVAWKNGLFQFSDTDIGTIMRAVARWYNVSVVYPDGIPSGNITGKIPRNTDLDNVLEIMRLSGVHFKVEGRKVTVLNGGG